MNENWGYPVLKPPYAVKMGHVIGLNGIIMGNNHHYGEIYIYIYCVWPIVCNSFHKLEHDFCTEGSTKEHDLEHDFCTEGSTKTARFRARFLHGGEHQNSTI